MSGRVPVDPDRTLFSFAGGCPEPCYCGYRGTRAECPPDPPADSLSGSSADVGAALAEVRGLDLGLTRLRPQASVLLPPVLAQVDGSAACRGVHPPVVAVTFGVLRNKIGRTQRSPRRLNDILHVPPATRAGVLLFANDPTLEDLWRDRRAWVDRLALLEPAFVVAPDFSVWAGDHALASRYNLVRSVRFIELLQDRGLASVPHFYWSTRLDLEAVAAWIAANAPEAIAIDMQCMPRPTDAFLSELEWLLDQLPQPPDLLVAGIDAGANMDRIRRVWPAVSMTRNYVPEVAKHVDLRDLADGRSVRERSDDPPPVLLERRLARAEARARRRPDVAALSR